MLSDRYLRSQLIPHIHCREDAGTSGLQSVSSLALSRASGEENVGAFKKKNRTEEMRFSK